MILKIVEECGLDVEEAKRVLSDRTFKDVVDADWAKSHQYGVTGVPTFVAGGRGLVGAQPADAIEHLLAEAGAHHVQEDLEGHGPAREATEGVILFCVGVGCC